VVGLGNNRRLAIGEGVEALVGSGVLPQVRAALTLAKSGHGAASKRANRAESSFFPSG